MLWTLLRALDDGVMGAVTTRAHADVAGPTHSIHLIFHHPVRLVLCFSTDFTDEETEGEL